MAPSKKPHSINIKFLKEALKEAGKAKRKNEVPVGAVIVRNGRIVARGHNSNISLNDPSAHAEIIALKNTALKLKNYRLCDCTIYVTLEPCPMCAGAIVLARLKEIVFGAYDKKTGACGSVFNIADNKLLNHRAKITGGVLNQKCAGLLTKFFRKRR